MKHVRFSMSDDDDRKGGAVERGSHSVLVG